VVALDATLGGVLSHVSLGARDLAASTRFFDACLSALGYARLYSSEKASGYGPPGGEAGLDVFRVRSDAPIAPVPGFHLAFDAPGRAAVDAFHAAALAAGGTDAGAPGLRAEYHARYYAAFVLDPDGRKIEAVYQGER
jgi:catechol 2,3-dioxygenase-like lactoylglutathione lyase family enzyme